MRQDRLDDEIASLREGVRANIYCATIHILLGMAYEKAGRMDAATESFREAAKYVLPFESSNHAILGERLAREGKLDEAVHHFLISLEGQPAQNDTRRNLGIAYTMLGKLAQALACFDEVLRRDPLDDRAWFTRGNALMAMKRYAEAEASFAKAAERVPAKVEYQSSQAVAQAKAGHRAQAVARLRALQEAHPELPELLNNLAWLLATDPAGDSRVAEESLAYALKAVEQSNRRNPDILDTLALAYAANGQFDQAIATAEEAIEAARTLGDKDFSRRMAPRLASYRNGKPWKE